MKSKPVETASPASSAGASTPTSSSRYKPYPRYKNSGVEWLGQLPDEWQIKPLKFAVRMNTEVLDEDTNPSLEFRYADISSITADGKIGETESTTFEKAPSRARRKVKKGDTISFNCAHLPQSHRGGR